MDIGEMLAQSADRYGDDTAVAIVSEAGTETLSYRELDVRANRIANGFLDAGIGSGDPIALLAHNSVEFFEVFFASQKIGAPIVPINVRLDPADMEYIFEDAQPRCLVAESELLPEDTFDVLESGSVPIYVVDGDGERAHRAYDELNDASADPPGITVGDEAVDSYFYTSGSTGQPKGVVHRHSDRVFSNMNLIAEFGLRHSDVTVNPLPMFHSGPLYTGFVPFFQFGVPTITLREFDPERTLEAIEEWDATVLGGVPAQYNRIAAAAEEGEYDLSSLRFWWVSGAPLTEELRTRCYESICDTHSIVYGATEIGPPVTTLPPEESNKRPASCGTGHMGQEVRLVSPTGDPDPDDTVEPGETGELIVRGESVMDRYLNRPERTAEVFVDDWYFTEDLAHRDEDGYIYVEGRKDNMIISGGENIYPSEVENALLEHTDIEDVAVLGVPHDEWGQTPKAFIVQSEQRALTAADVDAFCQESPLADYKRPREIAFVAEIPRNPSGGSVLKDELKSMA
ncbi:class I adenylate-forming enzyme family protein [Halovenus marina]|uniref:class I adenylate-forming enzyme family protein n=1 Tax=Halovenus marina TaxID=3396621 RepID=UPI003F5784F0